ncbi:MAG TPA: hypothetical protein PKW79_03530 [Rhabdochlamydiaceae bacterium]|nr:hypothetical protein [Rhabdochlamydiaceae bacterium]
MTFVTSERWYKLSLMEQLANIGSEVNRVMRARGDEKKFESAINRGLELFDLTLSDPRWQNRRREIARARELFCDAILGGSEYQTTFEDLDKYFYYFAYAVRSSK